MFDEANIEWRITTQAYWTYIESEYRSSGGFRAHDIRRVHVTPFDNIDYVKEAKTLAVERIRRMYDEYYGIDKMPNVPSSYEELDQSDDLHDDPKDARREALPSKAYCGHDATPHPLR